MSYIHTRALPPTAHQKLCGFKTEECFVCGGSGTIFWSVGETAPGESQESVCDECQGAGRVALKCQICSSPLYDEEGAICDACLEGHCGDKIDRRRRIALLRYEMAIKSLESGSRLKINNSLIFWAHAWDRAFRKIAEEV